MNLNAMTAEELRKLSRDLKRMTELAEAMTCYLGFSPVINITGPASISFPIFPPTAPPVSAQSEPDRAEPPAQVFPAHADEGHRDMGGSCCDVAAPPESIKEERPAEIVYVELEPQRTKTVDAPVTTKGLGPSAPILGPLTGAERAQILREVAAGKSRADIARDLNRRVQTVALFITSVEAVQKAATPNKIVDELAAFTKMGHEVEPAATSVHPKGSQIAQAAASVAADAARPALPSKPATVAAPAVAVPPLPIPRDDGRSFRQREIGAMLDGLRARKGFDAELDLELVEALTKGQKLAVISADLGVDSRALADRWGDLSDPLRDERGRLPMVDQVHLLAELRRKVREARGAAA
ncbi:MAG: hypothetical protein V4747_11380 [Pseudomonadota bacterium]